MNLAADSYATALSALAASCYAFAHARRLWSSGGASFRVLVAVITFVNFNAFIMMDEFYWGFARDIGMPNNLLYGYVPLGLKVYSMYLLSGVVIWLYTTKYKLVKAVGIPTTIWVLSHQLARFLGG